MSVEELNIEVPATQELTDEVAWNEYLAVCRLHRHSATYESAEDAAWRKLIQTLSYITRTASDERRKEARF